MLWVIVIYFGTAGVLFVALLVTCRGLPKAGERDVLLAPLFWGPILLHIVLSMASAMVTRVFTRRPQ